MNILHFASRLIERELKSSFSDCRTSRQKQKLRATVARIVKAFKEEREFHTGLISCYFLCFQCGNHLWTIAEAGYSVRQQSEVEQMTMSAMMYI